VGAALTQLLRTRLRLRVEPPWRGSAPPQRFTIGLSRNARPPQLTKANRQQLQGCAWQLLSRPFCPQPDAVSSQSAPRNGHRGPAQRVRPGERGRDRAALG
jgi:hypothetical protein